MSLNTGNIISSIDYNDLRAIINAEAGSSRRNISGYTAPSEVNIDDLALATSINPLINVINTINSDLINLSEVTAHQTLLYAISSLSTAAIDLAGRDKEGSNSGCKSGCMSLCQGCEGSCLSGCSTGCTGTCTGGCSDQCTSCTSCSGWCAGGCLGCTNACTGCSGTCNGCTGTCNVTCVTRASQV